MSSIRAFYMILTTFLAVISQCNIAIAQVLATQTGIEEIESYDSATERLTISAQYSYQWPPGPTIRTFGIEAGVIGAVSFTSTGTGGCTQINSRTFRCTSGITSFKIWYRYETQVLATEDGTEEFTYQSNFAREFSPTDANYHLFYPLSWAVLTASPRFDLEEPGHFHWVRKNIRSFVAQVRFQARPPSCSSGDPCIVARIDFLLGCVTDDGRHYNPDFWNDQYRAGNTQFSNNCYSYATNKYIPSSQPNPGLFAQPGYGSGKFPKFIPTNKMTCEHITERAKADGLDPISCKSSCPAGGRKIALVIDPDKPDYHWYREDSNGRWSHKPSWGRATDVDALNNSISNPRNANRNYSSVNGPNYRIFCETCFCISPICDENVK